MPRKGGVHVGQRVGCASEFGRESACGHRAAYVRGAGPRTPCQGRDAMQPPSRVVRGCLLAACWAV
jgi:hypothetical protein